MRWTPLPNSVGLEIRDLDVEHVSVEDSAALRRAFFDHSVLVIREADLTPASHLALARCLGEPEIYPVASARLPDHPEIMSLCFNDEAGAPDSEETVGRIQWHTDLMYTTRPSRGALLRAIELPPRGGETGFIDTASVYRALPDLLRKEIEGLEAFFRVVNAKSRVSLQEKSRNEAGLDDLAELHPGVVHALVLPDPATGVRSLNISPLFFDGIVGLGKAESDRLFARLADFALQDRFAYLHAWRPNDLVIWNNYRTLHCATGHEQRHRRLMHRITLLGDRELGRCAEAA